VGACGAGATGGVGLAQREEDVGAGRGAMALGRANGPHLPLSLWVVSPRRERPRHVLALCIQRSGILVKESQAMVGPVLVILNALAGVPATATDDHGGDDDSRGDTRLARGLPCGSMALMRPPSPSP
jgi:hypothetical protein